MKENPNSNSNRPLSFDSKEDLMKRLGLTAGSVHRLVYGTMKKGHCFSRKRFFEEPGMIGLHPNDSTATVWIKRKIGPPDRRARKYVRRYSGLNLRHCFSRFCLMLQ